MSGIDRDRVRAELESEWLDGLAGEELEEGRKLVAEVVDQWAEEADSTPDPDAVLKIQRVGLAARGKGLDVLRMRVVERRVDRLNADAFALGKAVLGGSVGDDEARSRGRECLDRAEALSADLDRLGVAADAPSRRALHEATMDALYAVERKGMSARLSREDPGAPSVF